MTNKAGHFISIEGIEGAGKSTAVRFLQQYLADQKIPLAVTREPGGTKIAEAVRSIFLGHHEEAMSPETELLLLFAGRAQNIRHIILPALARGEWVLADRFVDASFAYQGGGRGVDAVQIELLSRWIRKDLQPDLTILLDVPVAFGMQRIESRGAKDRMELEGVAFFERVRQVYLQRAQQEPQRFFVIDATKSLDIVQQQLITCVKPLLTAQ